ncbi:MAG: hypothetical protein GTO14_02010 [Anaerolineales bacterium]|nr:hypothetical protein [Anaerolineales bacterium]
MAGSRVYIIWTHPLFHESVRLLLRHPQVELVGATSDHSTARNQITALEPDVVIIEEVNGEGRENEDTVAILRAAPRVIHLSLANNELSIFHRERHTVTQVEDLVSLITSTTSKGEPTE